MKSFGKEDIDLKSKCLDILRGLQTHKNGWVFATPVDPVELGLHDYFEIVKKPMDLGTIQRKLETGTCHSLGQFKSDVRLTFENAMKYNKEGTIVHEMARELKRKFEDDLKKPTKPLDKERVEKPCGVAEVSDDEEVE
jgi:E1A/CREB-binding protein